MANMGEDFLIDNEYSNISRQELNTYYDEKGRAHYHLQTQVSLDEAIRQVEYDNEVAGGRLGKGSDEMVIMAEIPLELWSLDPLLRKAAFFKDQGDKALYTHYLNMFLQLQPKLKPDFQRRIFVTK